jgi:hypothetical protein
MAVTTGDFPPSELVTEGRAILDWIAAYLRVPELYPVLARVLPGDILLSLTP